MRVAAPRIPTVPVPTPHVPTPRLLVGSRATTRPAPTGRTASVPTSSPPLHDTARCAADYERLLHQAVRRELRTLAELAGWAASDDPRRATRLARHADLLVRLLLHHHAMERELLWPTLFGSLPAAEEDAARRLIADWASRASQLDRLLRDLVTAAQRWTVALPRPARDAFGRGCTELADAVDDATASEEAHLLPLLAEHLPRSGWRDVRRAARPIGARERMLVLGLVHEDATAGNRARLLAGLDPVTRALWRLVGRRRFHAAVVRLRGAPPAA